MVNKDEYIKYRYRSMHKDTLSKLPEARLSVQPLNSLLNSNQIVSISQFGGHRALRYVIWIEHRGIRPIPATFSQFKDPEEVIFTWQDRRTDCSAGQS